MVDETAIGQAISVAEDVDAVLLDSGNPTLEIKELGGPGFALDSDKLDQFAGALAP